MAREIARFRSSLEDKEQEINRMKVIIKGLNDQIDEMQRLAEKMLMLTRRGKY